MAKLYFRYGTMDSSKTANALMVRYNYLEKGQHPLILKPKIENRDGEKTIRSRIGISAECDYVEDILEKAEKEWFTGKSDEYKNIDCLIVDEAQFLSAKQVDAFARIVDQLNVPVICYGLRTDFTGHLFEGSQRLFEVASLQTAWRKSPRSAGAARRQSSTRGSRMERWSVPESRS